MKFLNTKFKLITFCLPFLYLFTLLAQQEKAFTQDLGRHLKTGEIITKCACVPNINVFSFTEPNHPFINHHWFSEVLFFNISHIAGQNSLLLLKVILVVLSFGIVYVVTARKNLFWATILTVPYVYIFSERFDLRPELFSFLFLSLFVVLINKFRESKQIKYLLLLPVIELLWVNMHIYFVVGMILFGFLLIEQLVLYKQKLNKQIVLIFLAVILSVFVNPNGIQGALEPFFILQNYGYSIVENQNLFFLNTFFFNPRVLIFELLSIILVFLLIATFKKQTIYSLLISVFAICVSYYMIRNLPLFVLITFPVFVYSISIFEEKIKHIIQKNALRSMIATVIIIGVVVSVISVITSPFFGYSFIDYDKRSMEFFKKNNIKGPIFNNFDIGSYLIYELYPQEKVFVDGRPEAYSVEFFNQYKAMQEDPTLFDSGAKKYTMNSIFFAHSDITPWAQTFLGFITRHPEWKTIYLDERIIILVKNTSSNQALIKKFEVKR